MPLFHAIAIVDIKLLHDAAGLGFHFDLGERLDLSRSNHDARQIAALDRSELRWINGVIGAEGRLHPVGATA